MWTAAFQWAVSTSSLLQRDADDRTEYFPTSSRMNECITPEMLTKYEKREGSWTDFDDFKSWRTEIWRIVVSAPVRIS